MTARRRWEVLSERAIEALIRVCGISAILFVFGIFFFVYREGSGYLFHGFDPVKFLTSIEWYPASRGNGRYGVLAMLAGTASVTILAMALAVPFGLGAAVFVSEFCGHKLRETLKIVIELLAAIPSVVWGFIGLTGMNPIIIPLFPAPGGLNVPNGRLLPAPMTVPIPLPIAAAPF